MNKEQTKYFLAGLICGEGCFSNYYPKSRPEYPEFRFIVDMHQRDVELLYLLRDEIGIGKVRLNINKNKGEKNVMCRYEITSHEANVKYVIPYFKKILKGYKLAQFEMWKEKLLTYYNDKHKRKVEGGKKSYLTRIYKGEENNDAKS